MATVGLEQTFISVPEEIGIVELCANVSSPIHDCPVSFGFFLNLTTISNTAGIALYLTSCFLLMCVFYMYITIIVSPIDYMTLSAQILFDACDTRQCLNVTIVDDFDDELNEDFAYNLERSPGLTLDIQLDPVSGQVEIVDNDGQYIVYYASPLDQPSFCCGTL